VGAAYCHYPAEQSDSRAIGDRWADASQSSTNADLAALFPSRSLMLLF